MKEALLSSITWFLGWLNSPPKIWVILFFLALFAGPEKIRKLCKDYQKLRKRMYLRKVDQGRIKPERPILSIEGDPLHIWGYSCTSIQNNSIHRYIYVHHNALPYSVKKGEIYDIWVNHESLRERKDYKDCFWRYVELEAEEEFSNYRHIFKASKTLRCNDCGLVAKQRAD